MGPAGSDRITRVLPYSGTAQRAPASFRYGDLTLCVSGFPAAFPSDARRAMCAALLPRGGLDRPGLGYSPFARHYWGNRFFFLLLQVLGCFGSLRSPASLRARHCGARVAPFGHPRI